jgi:hypothetical protein
MMVFSDKCKKCNSICNAIHFQQNFESWTSGNNNIDKYIQNIQLSVHDTIIESLEWISYDRFYDIRYIEQIEMNRANWNYEYINEWSKCNQDWIRLNKNMLVNLKTLDNLKDVTLEYINKVFFN